MHSPDPQRPDPQHPIEIVEKQSRPSTARRVIVFATLLALIAAFWVTTDRQTILEWKEDAGPIPFFTALAILPAIGFPTTPFFVLAGALYGTWTALIGSAIALSANLVLCYWISHSAMRPWLERRLSRTKYRIPSFEGSRAGAIRFTFLIKIAPGLPTFAKNYVVGMAGVPFGIYFAVSFVFTGIYAASFIVLGESIFSRDWTTGGLAVGVLALAGGVLVWFRIRRAKRAKAFSAQEAPEADPAQQKADQDEVKATGDRGPQ